MGQRSRPVAENGSIFLPTEANHETCNSENCCISSAAHSHARCSPAHPESKHSEARAGCRAPWQRARTQTSSVHALIISMSGFSGTRVTFIHILPICRRPTVTEPCSCVRRVASSGAGADGSCPHFSSTPPRPHPRPTPPPATADSTAERNHLPRQRHINWVLGKESSRAGAGGRGMNNEASPVACVFPAV